MSGQKSDFYTSNCELYVTVRDHQEVHGNHIGGLLSLHARVKSCQILLVTHLEPLGSDFGWDSDFRKHQSQIFFSLRQKTGLQI